MLVLAVVVVVVCRVVSRLLSVVAGHRLESGSKTEVLAARCLLVAKSRVKARPATGSSGVAWRSRGLVATARG